MNTIKKAVNLEFEIAHAVEFLHGMGVMCQPKDLREFYANYPELPLADNVFVSSSEKLQLEGRTLKVYKRHTITGVMALLERIELASFTKQQSDNIFACWAFTKYKQKMKKGKRPMEVETEELTEAARETLENRICDGGIILWNKFGIQSSYEELKPYYEAETEIPNGGVLVREAGSILYVSEGELVQEISVTDPEPLTVGTANDSPRVSVLGGNVKRRTAPISQMPKEQLDGMFALWAWNEHLKANTDEHKS